MPPPKLVTVTPREPESITQQRDYDLSMVRWCWSMLQQANEDTPAPLRNVLLECLLLHATVLLHGYSHSIEADEFITATHRYLFRAAGNAIEATRANWHTESIVEACEAQAVKN